MNASYGRDVVASTVPSAVIRLPFESITLLAHRAVSDGAGNGAMAMPIIVIATMATKAIDIRGIVGSRLKPPRRIAAE